MSYLINIDTHFYKFYCNDLQNVLGNVVTSSFVGIMIPENFSVCVCLILNQVCYHMKKIRKNNSIGRLLGFKF